MSLVGTVSLIFYDIMFLIVISAAKATLSISGNVHYTFTVQIKFFLTFPYSVMLQKKNYLDRRKCTIIIN